MDNEHQNLNQKWFSVLQKSFKSVCIYCQEVSVRKKKLYRMILSFISVYMLNRPSTGV